MGVWNYICSKVESRFTSFKHKTLPSSPNSDQPLLKRPEHASKPCIRDSRSTIICSRMNTTSVMPNTTGTIWASRRTTNCARLTSSLQPCKPAAPQIGAAGKNVYSIQVLTQTHWPVGGC